MSNAENTEPDELREASRGPSALPSILRNHRPAWTAGALLIFAIALAHPFHEVWSEDLSVVVPMYPRFEGELGKQRAFWKWIGETEQRFVAWQVSRNARALTRDPLNLFETGQCHPTRNIMALGEPMIALGVVGAPFALASDDPLRVYNWSLVASIALAALAMFLLVRDFTGVPAAGIVAGILYAFHSDHIRDINHYYIHDTAWTVLAIFFARRLFQSGAWRNAIGLALCISLQMAGSFYPLVGAALLALPLGAWLFARYGVENIGIGHWIAIAMIVAAAGSFIYGPYLEMRAEAVLVTRTDLHFAVWSEFLPGGGRFPGWIGLLLVGCALVDAVRTRSLREPHTALLFGIVLVGLMTIAGASANTMPPFYAAVSSLIPGLDAVRRPNEILSAMHICITLLAGLGTGWGLARVPRRFSFGVALVLILASFVTTLRPAWLGCESSIVYRAMPTRPAEEKLRFFEELHALGNHGPLLEAPKGLFNVEANRLLLSGYHHRKTSACVNELTPDAENVARLLSSLPDPAAIAELREMGFTTLILHHGSKEPSSLAVERAIQGAADRPGSPLRKVHAIASMTAYEWAEPESSPFR